MSHSYQLPLGGSVKLAQNVGKGGIIFFRSDFFNSNLAAEETESDAIDNTSVNLKSGRDTLLHISVRREEGNILFNSHAAKHGWGEEVVIALDGVFKSQDVSIAVYDLGNRYQIIASSQPVYCFDKRFHKSVDSISYGSNCGSPFSDILTVSTADSISTLFNVANNFGPTRGHGSPDPTERSSHRHADDPAPTNEQSSSRVAEEEPSGTDFGAYDKDHIASWSVGRKIVGSLPAVHPDSAITVLGPVHKPTRVFFQDVEGNVREAVYKEFEAGNWEVNGFKSSLVLFSAKMSTPLVALRYSDAKKDTISIFYLSDRDTLQEHCFNAARGWHTGKLNGYNIKVASSSRLAVGALSEWDGHCTIHLFAQDDSNVIRDYYYVTSEGHWREYGTVGTAIRGSSLAAMIWKWDMNSGYFVRLYCQDEQLHVTEYYCPNKKGQWQNTLVLVHDSKHVGPARVGTSIVAVQYGSQHAMLYWQDNERNIVEITTDTSTNLLEKNLRWERIDRPFTSPMRRSPIAVIGDHKGRNLRLYQQGEGNEIKEYCKDGNAIDIGWRTGRTLL